MTDLHLEEYLELGRDQGRGNLLGVQPNLTQWDYATQAGFLAKLAAYLPAAQARGWIRPNTIVAFPEYTGVWLATTREQPGVFRAASLAEAMRALALSHPLGLGRALLSSREPDRTAAALFRMQAGQMAHMYQQIFSSLAQRFQVTVVAGSIILPDPVVRSASLVPGDGPLYNVSAVFRPDGSLHPALVRKIYPISQEQPFLTPGRLEDLPAFDTPAGRLGLLICADSWYPEPYARLQSLGVDFLVVPSYTTGRAGWNQPWRGYDGAPMPAGVDPGDVQRLTEAQAWRAYALSGRVASSGACCGMNVFLHGQLWDMDAAGQSRMVHSSQSMESQSERAALLNLWL